MNNHKERYKNQVIQNPVTALLNKLSETILDRDFVGYINVFTSSELSNKVDVNEPGANGSWSLFYQACFQGFAELVQYMIKKQGAKVNQQNCSETPLMIVCKSDSNSQEVLKVVKMLCLESCIINASNSVGMTAFMLACFHGHTDVAELLLKMDVSLEATDNNDYNVWNPLKVL